MQMGRKRIFVGNLPPNTTRDEIKQKFSDFGNVLSVEIKSRLDTTTFAFLDVDIDLYQLDICFKTLENKKWKGNKIKLELAKESFLSRLQREREQNDTSKSVSNSNVKPSLPDGLNINNKSPPSRYIEVKNETLRNDAIDEDINDSFKNLGKLRKFRGLKSLVSEVDNEPVIQFEKIKTKNYEKGKQTLEWSSSDKPSLKKHLQTKFESYSDVWKDSSDVGSEVKAELSGKGYKKMHSGVSSSAKGGRYPGVIKKKNTVDWNTSEQKRIQSVIEKNIAFTREKKAIAQALANVDSKKTINKKIMFNSDDEGNGCEQETEIPQKKQNRSEQNVDAVKPHLFSEDELEDEEEDGTDFKIKEHFEGVKGQKLLKLQSLYGNDSRFILNERFQDSDEDKDEEPVDVEVPIEDEIRKQMDILESVVGHPISRRPKPEESSKPKLMPMLRFDPTKPDHAKYEIKQETNLKKPKKKRKKDNPLEGEEEEAVDITKKVKHRVAEPVSKDKFYKISDSLKDSFRKKDRPKVEFSLLSMFGAVEKDDEHGNEHNVKDDNFGASSQYELNKKIRNCDQFSSVPAELEDEVEANDSSKGGQTADAMTPEVTKQAASLGVWRESFFFNGKDDRLKEGLDLMKISDYSEDMEKLRGRRQELKRTFRLKVQHNSQLRNMWHKKLGKNRMNRRNNPYK